MKRNLYSSKDSVFGMANLNPAKTGLEVVIWSDHGGKYMNRHHNTPRVKIGSTDFQVSVSIESQPRILASPKSMKKSDLKKIQEGMNYVGRNYDLFLKHFEDENFQFDDEDLFNALRQRGEYR